MNRRYGVVLFVAAVSLLHARDVFAQPGSDRHRPLAASDIDDIARLVMMEDRRQIDTADLARLLAAGHPEVRRRAALAVARVIDGRGLALLRARPLDADTAVAATAVFAIGQYRDTSTVGWLDSLLQDSKSAPTVASEAAIALGKVKSGGARAALARFLSAAVPDRRTNSAIREALLSIGRSTARGDMAPILQWTRSSDEEFRWRATWALLRPRDPAAVGALLVLSGDRSSLVRSWAVRGLAKPQADSANVGTQAEFALIRATRDGDRRVRTEAVRTLGTYADSATVATLLVALESPDSWLSVSAAEGLGRSRSALAVAPLVAATRPNRSCAVRVVAMQALQALQPSAALSAAMDVSRDSISYCRTTAMHALLRAATSTPTAELNARLDTLRAARRAELASADLATRLTSLRAIAAWADSSDLGALLEMQRQAAPGSAAAGVMGATITAVRRRLSGVPAGQGRPAPAPVTRSFEEYRRIVERWIVPDYNGAPRPTARWDTPRGAIELELYPGEAPMAVDDFAMAMDSQIILGTEFSRVVPDFVAQQQTIRGGNVLRDEVNRRGLTRANLAWATAGLDTGSPGYTLGHTPQPHNEGDFTAVGRVIRGLDVMDRLELGDRITGARMLGGALAR